MSYAVVDVETTIYENGHPFSACNKLCLVGIRIADANHVFKIEYDEEPYGKSLERILALLSSVDLVCGFNLKFDLNWLARYGIELPTHVRVFDCQLAEYLLSNQSSIFPSLDNCLAKYNLGAKSTVVLHEYWDRGIDTPQVPLDTLQEYLADDLRLTDGLYRTQLPLIERSRLGALCGLHMQDLRVLQEMEFNGILLDWDRMEQKAVEARKELNEINGKILSFVPETFRTDFNTGSNDHVSCLLYGGKLTFKRGQPYQHTYRTGPRAGTTETRHKWEEICIDFPRLVEPLDGTKLAKDGFWSTGADILKQLPKPKKLLGLLLQQAATSKLLDTYLTGFPKKAKEMDWQDGCIHSTLNQAATITGRLSSSKPNQQNLPEIMNEFIVTRF